MPSKKTLYISGVVVAVLLIVAAIGIMMTNPMRTFDAFMDAVEAKDEAKALSFVATDITQNKHDNIEFFLDDWTTSDSVSVKEEEKNEAWRTRDEGDKKITVPTPHLFAHNFQQYATVTFDDFEDPVIVVLRRTTKNGSSILAQLFRGWEVVQIKYQPIDESELDDIEADDVDDTDDAGDTSLANTNSTESDTPDTNSGTTNTNE